MRMLDLYCGRFGWSKAFAARGWECVGLDLVAPPEIPNGCTFIQADILKLRYDPAIGFYIIDGSILGFFDFVCASSPCEQFSVWGMKHFHPNPKHPEMGLKLFNHTRDILDASGVLYVMENVRAAQQFVGDAVQHCGPFYLWGTGVPVLMHKGIIKGLNQNRDPITGKRDNSGLGRRSWSSSPQRLIDKAIAAEIPFELALCVADYAERLLEVPA